MFKFITTRLGALQAKAVQRAEQAQAEATRRAAFDAESEHLDAEIARLQAARDEAVRTRDAAFADPLIVADPTTHLQ